MLIFDDIDAAKAVVIFVFYERQFEQGLAHPGANRMPSCNKEMFVLESSRNRSVVSGPS